MREHGGDTDSPGCWISAEDGAARVALPNVWGRLILHMGCPSSWGQNLLIAVLNKRALI